MPATEPESHSQAPPQDKTILRGARKPKSPKNAYIKNIKEVDLSTLKCMRPDVNDIYFVRLKSDDEGGSKEKRQDHIDMIFDLCCTHSRDAAGNEFEGIEVRFEQAIPAYAGHFNPVVVSQIKADKNIVVSVDKKHEMAMCEEHSIPNRNWGSAKISLEKDEWDRMPMKSSKTFKCGDDQEVYKYNCGRSLGKGVTIYVIDGDGFLDNDFANKPARVQSGLIWHDGGEPGSHGTLVTSIAAGETCGIAPEADVWVWIPRKLTNVHILAALEHIVIEEEKKKKAWESDNAKTYYSVLNCSWCHKRSFFEGDDEEFKDAKGTLSTCLEKLISLGVFPVAAAGNETNKIDSSKNNLFPRNVKDVLLVGSSNKQNQISKFSNYGPGVIAYAPGEEIPIIGSTKLESGTSFAAPHVSGLLACLLSSELAQKPPPKSAEQKRWTIGDVCTKLQRSFSRVEHEFQGFPINVISNKIVISDLRIVILHDIYNLYLPPTGVGKAVTLQDLVHFCDLLEKADYKECDSFFETTLKIRNVTQSCLRAVRFVTVVLDGKSHSKATGAIDGLARSEVAKDFGNYISGLLPKPPK